MWDDFGSAGIVDQQIQAAVLLDSGVNETLTINRIADISLQIDRVGETLRKLLAGRHRLR